ncbi:hypothetical protein BGX27_001319, partial [Mortierella sp. AM989]
IPEGIPVSQEERTQLTTELAQLKQLSSEAQQTYTTIHATIQQYQQLVLSTHAQVAAAKRSLMQARGSNNNSNNNLYSNTSSRTSSPPSSPTSYSTSMSVSSPRSRSNSFSFASSLSNPIIEEDNNNDNNDNNKNDVDEEARLRQLGQEHAELGHKLTELLRDKASAEETKKRMNDCLLKAKARIKELERKLGE